MAYKRNSYSNYNSYGPTTVYIHWSQKAGAYSVKYSDLKYFGEIQAFNHYMKTKPWGEYEYDPETKVWFLAEKHVNGLMEMINLLGPSSNVHHFTIDFQKKPDGQVNTAKFVPVEIYKKTFTDLSGSSIEGLDYAAAKKLYRRAALNLHPDRGGCAAKMASLNEAWMHIESQVYNVKKDVEYA